MRSPDWGTARYGVRSPVRQITAPNATAPAFEYLGDGNTTRLEAGSVAYTNGSLGLATATTGTDPQIMYRRTPDGAWGSSHWSWRFAPRKLPPASEQP